MTSKWEDRGSTEGLSSILPGPTTRAVENQETGEVKEVYIGRNQTEGEAIENGQFTDRDVSNMKK